MTAIRGVPLEDTERTLLRLRESAGLYWLLVQNGSIGAKDRRSFLMGSWMTLLSYTEFYVDGVLDLLFDHALLNLPPGAEYLMRRESSKSHGTWQARKDTFKNVFGLNITQFKSWASFDGAIWVRNSIAHGSGGLTRMQKASEAAKAEGVGVTIIDGQLFFSHAALSLCAEVCCSFVEHLDQSTRRITSKE